MRKSLPKILIVGLVLASVLLSLVLVPGAGLAQPPVPRKHKVLTDELQRVQEVSPELAMSKIDPLLQEAAEQGGKDLVDLYVSVKAGTDLSKYMSRIGVRPVVFGGTQNVYGQTMASNLLKIAQEPNVVALVKVGADLRDTPYDPETEDAPARADNLARLEALRANELTYAEAEAAAGDVSAQGWFDVQDGHKSSDAWEKGFTGEGVVVGVLDDGIDFGHPDLQGTYATVTDPTSPYYGWPMAFSQVSMLYFWQDIYFGVAGIASGWGGSRWTDAQFTAEAYSVGGVLKIWYAPLGSAASHGYRVPDTSRSGEYKLGSHPDRNLLNVYGERAAVLVVDEGARGVYDTVYVDLDNDYDFTDEKPVTKTSPEIYRDMDGDGYADISGGLLVWISDGANVPPTADWLWGVTCADSSPTMQGCPDSGELVLFAGPFDSGYTHGTQCASNIAGQGVVNDGLTAQPFRVGGMVQGGAPDVGLMDFGNHYYTGTDEDEYLVAALGYDGWPNSGDEVQITTNSYGNFRQMWGSWGYFGRLITALNMTIAPSTVWVFSSGNEGPGYGPEEGDGGPTTIMAGSSTQFGSTNWDSIASADQIMYGDVTAFFSKGPNRDGSSGLDVLANGGRGSGDEGINYFGFNGAESWDTWGGTSRSSPVAGSNLALVYQAYKARYGVWPTWDVAKALLKSGATNASSTPFYQGAGVVNADRATDLAAGIYGVYATPDEWQVGDWEGTEYLNFAKVAYPGDTFAKTYTVYNPSGHNITADLSDGVMTLISETELSLTTSDESLESSFNFHSPDYLMELDPSLIPADAEVMIVRYVHPYSTFDPAYDFTANPNSSWRYLLYNWTDVNGDGNLWVDADGNGVVNHVDDVAAGPDNDGFYRPDYSAVGTEIQEGEYVRVDYDFGGLAQMIIVRDPLERVADGYFFGWQHRYNDGSIPTTTFQIGLEFYKRADWDWLSVSDRSVSAPAEGSVTFDAAMAIPADAAPGVYEGVIFMNDPGDANHAAHESALPVVVNVIAELPDGGSVTLGGGPKADTMYQNSWTYGYFNWYGGGWTGAGDWRHYFLNLDEDDLEAGNLLVHTSWGAYPTDINTWVLGPTDDCASNGVEPCAWFEPDLGQPDPTIFGPYTLQPIGWNEPFRSGAAYPFQTNTDGPDDWLKVPLEREGLHEIALHNVLYNGEDLTEQFQVDIGTIAFDAAMDSAEGIVTVGPMNATAYTETGTIELQFTPTLELPDLNATLTGGLATTLYGPFTVLVPDSGQCYSAWCASNVYEPFTVTEAGTTRLRVHLDMLANQDADFFLVYDADDNGVAEEGIDDEVGSSGNSSGTDEEIILDNPALGRYFAVIDGYDVDPDSGVELDWWYEITAPGALPADPVDVFDDAVEVSQDDPIDPATASYSLVATTMLRSGALHAMVTDIPSGADVDLYVTDYTGAIVAMSQNAGNADEELVLRPVEGEYRFEEGTEYTVWVHGYDVPTPPASPTLHVWWDQLNLWLSASHPDVSVSAINAGETVSVMLHFDKPGWSPGDADMSARLIAGPSVLPLAFDELVIIERDDPPGPPPPPTWDPANLDIEYTAESARGPSPFVPWKFGGVPVSTALAQGGEAVTWSLTLTNNDPLTVTLNVDAEVDNWGQWYFFGDPYFAQTFDSIVVEPMYGTCIYDPDWVWVDWVVTLPPGASDTCAWTVTTDTSMQPLDDHLSILWEWNVWGGSNIAGADVYYGTFRTTGSYKMSTPGTVLPGETFTYNFSLANPSAEDRFVYLSDPLPDEVIFVSVTGDATYEADTHTVSWGGLLPGTSLSTIDFDVVVQAKSDLGYGALIENEASLVHTLGGTPFAYLYAYTDVGFDTYLEIEKTVDVIVGRVNETLNYTIVFRNTGDETAFDATMTDYLPPSLDLVAGSIAATTGTPVWDESTGLLSWVGDLAAGAEVTITFQATPNELATPDLAIINMAELDADNTVATVYHSAHTEAVAGSKIFLPMVAQNHTLGTRLTILHTNDFHGRLESDSSGRGGSAYMAGVISDIRDDLGEDNVFLVDAGDEFFGAPPISQLMMGESTIEVYNMLGYDVAAFGNHEFDKGQEVLMERVEQSDFPWIGANIVLEGTDWEHPTWVEPYVILSNGEVDLGVIGVDTDETPLVTLKGTTDGLEFTDLTDAVLHYYDEVMAQADALIVVAHMGTEDSGPFEGLETVAQELIDAGKPVDLMIGGHQHQALSEPVMVGDTAIVAAGYYGRWLGRVDVGINPETKKLTVADYELITINNELTPDPDVEAEVAYWADLVAPLVEEVVGYSNVDLVRDYNAESNMGNLVADGMLWKADEYDDGEVNGSVDIAFTNPGGLRADIIIPEGTELPYEVTWGDTFDVLPFGNTLFLMDLTGEQVMTLLNQSANLYKGILQTGGATWYWYNDCNCDAPTSWGAYGAEVGGEPLDPEATYRVVTNNFLAPGGDGWVTFAEGTNRWDTYYDMQWGFNEYIQWYNANVGPIDYEVEGRITQLDKVVTILHTNDMHGNFPAEVDRKRGFAYLASLIEAERAKNPNTLLLDAGDTFQGNALAFYYKERDPNPISGALNLVGYDAFTIGNHEFNFGPATFATMLGQLDFPILGKANLVDDGSYGLANANVQDYINLDVDGLKVSIFGLTNPDSYLYEVPTNIPGLTFYPATTTAQSLVPQIRTDEDPDLLIGLTHIGRGADREVAEEVPGIDVIVGGHSHSRTDPAEIVTSTVNTSGTLIGQASSSARYLGKINIGFTGNATDGYEIVLREGYLIPSDEAEAADPTVTAYLQPFVDQIDAYNATVIGQTTVPIDALESMTQETNGGNMHADAAVWAIEQHGIAVDFHLGGAMSRKVADAATPANPVSVTRSDIFTLMPYENALIVIRMNGPQIKEVLERGYRNWYYYNYEPDVGGYERAGTCMVSPDAGNQIQYLDTYPELPNGNNVVAMVVNGTAVDFADADTYYNVSTHSYLAGGACNFNNDGETIWPLDQIVTDPYVYVYVRDSLMDYVEAMGTISPAIEGRLVILDKLITILHTNDTHGTWPTTSYYGTPEGMTYLASLIAAERAKNPNTLLLDAGDTFQGNAFAQYFRNATPNPIAGGMNLLGYDAMTLGNHEFNFGPTTFATMLGQLDMPILGSANLDDDGSYGFITDNVEDYINLDVDGLKVSIFGLTNPRVYRYELPTNIPGLVFHPATETAASLVPTILATEDPDLLIGLTHIGYQPYGDELDSDELVAQEVGGIDVIIGGHSHSFIDPSVIVTSAANPEGTLIAQTGRYAQYLGKVNIGLVSDGNGGYDVVLREGYLLPAGDVDPDADLVAYLTPFEAELDDYTSTEIGDTTAPLDALDAYTEETTGANVQADAAVWMLTDNGIDVDFHLSGAMSNRKVADDATAENPVTLTVDDMYTLMPYENSLLVMEMNGPQIKAVLERAYRNYYYYTYVDGYGGYSHYTTCMLDINADGVITYNDTYPDLPDGNNVVSLSFDGTEVDFADADTYYNVSSVNYLAAGSCNFNDDGVTIWPLDQMVADTQYYVRDSVIDYVTAMGTISPAVEGRLQFVNLEPLVVLHTGDEHGWLETFSAYGSPVTEGGAANLMARFTEIEGYSVGAEGFLLTSGGDNWTGPSITTWFEGEPMVEVMNAMGYDVSVIGNHEFDFGRDVLNERIAEADYPFLSANIYYSGTTTLADFVTPYVVKDIGGVKVGLVGLTDLGTPTSTHPKNISDLVFGDYETALRREVPNMEAEGAELIIVVAHVGLRGLADLAANVGDLGIDLMEGGHSHELGTRNTNGVPIIGGGDNMQTYAKTVLFLDPTTHDVVDFTQSLVRNEYVTAEGNPVTPDPTVQAIVDYWAAEEDAAMGEVIGYTENGIARGSSMQRNYVTDSWLWAYPAGDFAMTNTGGFRAAIDVGDITMGDVVGVLPFDNVIVDCAITGAQVVENLEVRDVAVAGLTYTYHREDGQRVVDTVTLLADGSPLDMNATYHVLVNDFMYFGGDGFLFGEQDPDAYPTAIQWRQPVIDWTKAQNTDAANPIDALIDDQERATETP